MATKKKHHRKQFTIPMAVIGGFAPIMVKGLKGYQSGGATGLLQEVTAYSTGYHIALKQWQPKLLIEGMTPVIVGGLVHKFIGGKLGINRMLANAGVPVLRL